MVSEELKHIRQPWEPEDTVEAAKQFLMANMSDWNQCEPHWFQNLAEWLAKFADYRGAGNWKQRAEAADLALQTLKTDRDSWRRVAEKLETEKVTLKAALKAKEQELNQICEAHNYGVNILTELAAAKLELVQARQQAVAECVEICEKEVRFYSPRTPAYSACQTIQEKIRSLTPPPALTKEK